MNDCTVVMELIGADAVHSLLSKYLRFHWPTIVALLGVSKTWRKTLAVQVQWDKAHKAAIRSMSKEEARLFIEPPPLLDCISRRSVTGYEVGGFACCGVLQGQYYTIKPCERFLPEPFQSSFKEHEGVLQHEP